MKLRSDDDIYRARLLYLGPPGYTLPIHVSYAQWALFAVLTAGLVAALVLITGTLMSAGFAVGLALFLTSYISRSVDPDRPAKKVIKVALTDWQQIKPTQPEKLRPLSARHIRITDPTTTTNSTGARR